MVFGCTRRAGFEACGLRVVFGGVLELRLRQCFGVVRPAVLCGCYGAGMSLGCVPLGCVSGVCAEGGCFFGAATRRGCGMGVYHAL